MSHALTLTGGFSLLSDTSEESPVVYTCVAEDDTELMRAHIEGNNAAFGRLFDRHHMRLYLYCARMVADPATAEDVMQEVWERVVRLRERPVTINQPTALLFTIARRLCLNQLRGARRFAPLTDEEPRATHDSPGDLEEIAVEALARLPLPYREVLALNIYSGYGLEEMAPLLGISPSAVWKRASRARAMLRKEVYRMIAHEPAAIGGGR